MLNKAGDKINRIFKPAVLILLSAQILVGCLWGFLDFGSLQQFPDTVELVKLSGTLKLIGETGIIYPALLIVVRALTANGPVLFYHVMYLLQIALAFAAWFVFAKNVFGTDSVYKKIFFALAVVTNPFAMQVHLAVLEYSFVSSFAALLISFQIRFMRDWKKSEKGLGLERALRDISVTSLFWLAAALTRKEFTLIGAVPILALLITIIKCSRKGKVKASGVAMCIVVVLAFAGIICMGDSLFRSGEKISALDGIKRSIFYRVAWSEDFRDRYHWPSYLTDFTDEGMMTHIMNDPGLVRTEYTEYVTERFGSRETTDRFYEWGKEAFSRNKKAIVKETLSDIVGYLFVPIKTEHALRGCEYPGFAAGNYDVMKQHNPLLTKIYLRYFSVLYVSLAVAVLAAALTSAKRYVRNITLILPAGIIAISCAVYYSFLGCNVFDHRKVVFTTCLWAAFMLGGTGLTSAQKEASASDSLNK